MQWLSAGYMGIEGNEKGTQQARSRLLSRAGLWDWLVNGQKLNADTWDFQASNARENTYSGTQQLISQVSGQIKQG